MTLSRLLCAGQLTGAVVVFAASIAVGRSGDLSEQVTGLVLAIGGVGVAAVTALAWLMLGRRRIVTRREGLVATAAHTFDSVYAASDGREELPVATMAMSRYHRPECQLVRGKAAQRASVIEQRRASRTPCAVCRP